MDAETLEQTPWSQAHSHCLPQQWLSRKEKVFGISFDAVATQQDHTGTTARQPALGGRITSAKAYLLDHAAFCVVDLSQPAPPPEARLVEVGATMHDLHGRHGTTAQVHRERKEKRTKASVSTGNVTVVDNFKLVKKFQPLLYAGFTATAKASKAVPNEQDGEVAAPLSDMVVVERPWLAIMQNLPPPLYREKYGV